MERDYKGLIRIIKKVRRERMKEARLGTRVYEDRRKYDRRREKRNYERECEREKSF